MKGFGDEIPKRGLGPAAPTYPVREAPKKCILRFCDIDLSSSVRTEIVACGSSSVPDRCGLSPVGNEGDVRGGCP